MCKRWYQLITCTEPVGALNRRSFFMPQNSVPNLGMWVFLSLLLVLVSLQVFFLTPSITKFELLSSSLLLARVKHFLEEIKNFYPFSCISKWREKLPS